jgi:hypothetical protein
MLNILVRNRSLPWTRLAVLRVRLSTLIIVTDADGTLGTSSTGPVATNVGGGVAVLAGSSDDPETNNGLGEDIEDGVDDDLSADLDLPGATSSTPDAVTILVLINWLGDRRTYAM